MMIDATPPAAPPTLVRADDRCDRCQAQAFVKVEFKVGALLFCGHHYAEHEMALLPVAVKVTDERHLINPSPSISASPA